MNPSRRDGQPEIAEQGRDLSRGHAHLLVEQRPERDRAWTDLRGRRPERVRGLAGVATLYSFVAATTASDFYFEAPRVDAHLEILLPLVFDALESSFATAARAATWQLDRDRLVDALGSRAVRLCPIRLARLASWPLGIWLGVVLGVGGGLTLGGAPQLLDDPEQLADARFELLDNPIGALLIALEPVNARSQPRVLDLEPQDPLGGGLRESPSRATTSASLTGVDISHENHNRVIRSQGPANSIRIFFAQLRSHVEHSCPTHLSLIG